MTLDTLALLAAQNTRTVFLLLAGDEVRPAPPGTPGAAAFVLRRVPAREIQSNLLFALLGRDGYHAFAAWSRRQASERLEDQQALARTEGEAVPFDDTPEDDERWRLHSVALGEAADEAVLEAGLHAPTYAQARDVLGPYRAALVRELVQWGRQGEWTPPKDGEPPQEAEVFEQELRAALSLHHMSSGGMGGGYGSPALQVAACFVDELAWWEAVWLYAQARESHRQAYELENRRE